MDLFDDVVELGNRSRGTLGLFPREALRERAQAGELLIALVSQQLCGYLLYRVSRGRHPRRAHIIHLCVEPDRRGQGIARALVNALKAETQMLDGIRLKCRRDYAANRLWPKLGFELLGEGPGRSQHGTTLDIWWYSNDLPLFRRMWETISEQAIVAVLDANVVFDLESEEPDAAEAQALMSDWLSDQVLFVVTPELNAEIGRQADRSTRARSRALAGRFPIREGDRVRFDSVCEDLTRILGQAKSESQASDIRELAWAVASKTDYFITRDQRLLDRREAIMDDFELCVLRPSTLIAQFDELAHASAYQPRRFEGSRLMLRPATQRDEREHIDAYLDFSAGERKPPFINALRKAMARSPQQVLEVVGSAAQPLVLHHIIRRPHVLEIPVLRVAKHRLGPTVLRHLLAGLINSNPNTVIEVTDPNISEAVALALSHLHFVPVGSSWLKPCLDYIGPFAELEPSLMTLFERAGVSQALEPILTSLGARNHERIAVERMLSPAKFTDLALPCYIIPIRAKWAAQLFETRLAEQELFGLPPELGFRLDNVYYSATKRKFQFPARLLWYVSKTKATHTGAGMVRAVSYLDGVVRGSPKALFSRFRRLGVYRWADLMKMTGGARDAVLAALEFSGTELLNEPIPWPELQASFARHTGKNNQLQGPLQITSSMFFELYSAPASSS